MWTFISVSLALVINFDNPEIPKNKKWIKNNYLQNKTITGFPYQYFKGEVLTDEMVEFRIRLIYIHFMIYITVNFSVGVGPIVGQAVFLPTVTSIERLIPNQLDSQTNQQEFLLDLRGGGNDFSDFILRIIVIWVMAKNHTPTEAFQPVGINQVFGHPGQVGPTPRIAPKLQENPINRNNPGQGACRVKEKNQDGTLTKEQRRNLPSPDDVIIPEQNVIIRDGQAKWKVKNHGHDFGIESALDSKGRFKTGKTPKNIQAFKEEIKNLVLNGERIEGTYRKSEPDGYPASHFYDPETRKNAIFKKETTEFVSAWKLTEGQADDLLNNGNVGDY